MDYHQCLAYLDRLGNEVLTMKFGLRTIRSLLDALGDPHLEYPSVIIAGTNGKGSVSRFLSSIFTAASIRSGLYTSPHLVNVEERFVISNRPLRREILSDSFTQVTRKIRQLSLPVHPTYFETLTATAFQCFSEQNVEVAFLEVGMGGRLDSTNVVDPLLAVVTPIGFDHQEYLGNRLEDIAREKAGIFRDRGLVLLAPQRAEVRRVMVGEAVRKEATLTILNPSEIELLGSNDGRYSFSFRGLEYRLGVYGRHQVENAALAILAVYLLRERGYSVPDWAIREGISRTSARGTLHKLPEKPAVFLDGAHNRDSAQKLANFLKMHTEAPRSLIFGIMRDKEISQVLSPLAACFNHVYLTAVDSPRAASTEELKRIFPAGTSVSSPFEAYHRALGQSATLVISGSFYLVGEILRGLGYSPGNLGCEGRAKAYSISNSTSPVSTGSPGRT